MCEKLKLSFDEKMYGLDVSKASNFKNSVVIGYRDPDFKFWMVVDHHEVPENWELSGRVEQKMLEIGSNCGTV